MKIRSRGTNIPVGEHATRLATLVILLAGSLQTACMTPAPVRPYRPAGVAEPVSVPAAANCTFSGEYPASKNCCVVRPYVTSLRVDVAYARLMREYNFSQKPRMFDEELEAIPELFHGHHYTVEPGVSYRLGGVVLPTSDVRLFRGVWIGVTITHIDREVTQVQAEYCQPGGYAMEDQLAWHLAVQASLKSALPAQSNP